MVAFEAMPWAAIGTKSTRKFHHEPLVASDTKCLCFDTKVTLMSSALEREKAARFISRPVAVLQMTLLLM